MKFNRWLVVALALIVALLSVACGGEEMPLSSAPAPQAHVAPKAPTLLQFTAGEHVLGFTPNAAYAANGSHAYRVEFVNARPTTPLADAAPGAETGTDTHAAPLARVSYSQLWPGITLTYDQPGCSCGSTRPRKTRRRPRRRCNRPELKSA